MTKSEYLTHITKALPLEQYVKYPDWDGSEKVWVYYEGEAVSWPQTSSDGIQYEINIYNFTPPLSEGDIDFFNYVQMAPANEIPDDVANDSLNALYPTAPPPPQKIPIWLIFIPIVGMGIIAYFLYKGKG